MIEDKPPQQMRQRKKSKKSRSKGKSGSNNTQDDLLVPPVLPPPAKKPAELKPKVSVAKVEDESSLAVCLQVLFPYLLAGMGMVMAGMVLHNVQVSKGIRQISHEFLWFIWNQIVADIVVAEYADTIKHLVCSLFNDDDLTMNDKSWESI